jgi:hypothetical protein
MQRVYKYPVRVADVFSVEIPRGAQLLDVQVQHGEPQLWALVNPDAAHERRWFRLAGTGHDIREAVKGHVGSFQLQAGSLVFHVFEIVEPEF